MNDDIKKDIESHINTVNNYLVPLLRGNPEELYQASSHYIISGGKRLRPIMTIKSCEMFGGSEQDALPAASAVEFIHNFSLVHDDIMDNDDFRHGIPTVHKHFGIPLAILSGDILFSKAFQILSCNSSNSIKDSSLLNMVQRLATACIDICEGQSRDMQLSRLNSFPTEGEYIEMISKKTAALFEVSCSLGALSSKDATEEDVNNLASFGRNSGIAFQLIDDLIGIKGDSRETGKSVGNDVREGKKTFPILLSIKNADSYQKQKILNVFGNKDSSSSEMEEVVKVISSLHIEQIIRDTAMNYIKKAMDSITSYEQSKSKKILQEICFFIINRSK